jgi:hypothetical protein
MMATKQKAKLTPKQKALLNLDRWSTIYIGHKWYVLSKAAKDLLSEYISNDETPSGNCRMEVANEKDGVGTGEFEEASIAEAIVRLRDKNH